MAQADQDRISLRVRPRHRRAALADRGAAGAKSDVPGEETVADAAVSHQAAALRAAGVRARRLNPYLDEAEYERVRDAIKNARNEGLFTPQTLTREQLSATGRVRRIELGRRRGRSDDRLAVRAALPTRPRFTNCACLGLGSGLQQRRRQHASGARPRGLSELLRSVSRGNRLPTAFVLTAERR